MLLPVPYGNDRRTSRFPAVTIALIAANVVIFVWLWPYDRRVMVATMGLTPSHPAISNILSSMFVHAGIFHLSWNMLFLWLFGPSVEDALGQIEYAIFYFGSGFAAALLHVVVTHTFTPEAADLPMVGSSGAIAGILGIFAVRFYKTKIRLFWPLGIFFPGRPMTFTVSAMVCLGIWFGWQLYKGLMGIAYMQPGSVAYWSHIGGMLFGMMLAYALKMGPQGTREYRMADVRMDLDHGMTGNGMAYLLDLLEKEPENPSLQGDMGKAYAIRKDSANALLHYRKCVEICLQSGEPESAMGRFAEMRHYYPDARLDLKSEYQLARYLIEKGFCTPALRLFEGIAVSYPGTPEAEISLMKAGDLYLDELGDMQGARRCYERFLKEYSQSAYRAMVEKSLDEVRGRS